jgi:hypothetical protein
MTEISPPSVSTRLLFALQRVLLVVARSWYAMVDRRQRDSVRWVVGPEEIASMVRQVSEVVPGSVSVSLSRHAFYEVSYTFSLRREGVGILDVLERVLKPPIILGRLCVQARGFIYIGQKGFLVDVGDARAFELGFLKKHGRSLVCMFTGDDIRAPRLLAAIGTRTGTENLVGHFGELDELFASDSYDALKRRIAAVADRYADALFSAPVDQVSYLTRRAEVFRYFLPDEYFKVADNKYATVARPVILHAPSALTIKGTPSVREAIRELREAGYEFEYLELVGVTNEVVRRELDRAHIVLNQFYGYLPGVFGIEALAAGCAMLASADPAIERSLPPGAAEAWLITRHDEIAEKLKSLLDDPARIELLGRRGHDWAWKNASSSASGSILVGILDRVLDGSYDDRGGYLSGLSEG